MIDDLVNLMYLLLIHNIALACLIVLNVLIQNYLLLLNNLILKVLTYPNIYYLTICLGMSLVFAYKVVKLII